MTTRKNWKKRKEFNFCWITKRDYG